MRIFQKIEYGYDTRTYNRYASYRYTAKAARGIAELSYVFDFVTYS